ncbi:MAG: membrane protein insertase YidC [Azoarcus sp.]|uniref:Membrane protein insertase YidC n=1 Tax=Parazoarcus communis TaxID=41977 RepID=A0A2U8GRL2_9RHOO|nr:membrane protein insertase YidC [Parazoarcus communis]AWI76201.1 membrane protein insertase YidC [Parazoarcus communis]PLX72589.1 MAG: membrane protein insertase YidC [Azoarcus sp.]TVT54012.1 MAG: membrane protein insertase YidC [Azoarcus sp. PHD]|tara:strand:- start:49645 stop:51288 length:1644 start_codon:yes stop_codon:yes gene_type:complete
MDQRRLILLLVFSLSLVMLWDGWIKHNQPAAPAPVAAAANSGGASVPTPSALAAPGASALPATAAASAAPTVRVVTDLMRADVSAEGGSIVRLELVKHKSTADHERGFLLFDNGEVHRYSAESGLIGTDLPTHRTVFALPEGEQVMKDGEDTLVLRLEAPEQNGVKVTKVMTFHRGSYLVNVDYEIANGSGEPVSGHAYFQLTRDGEPAEQVQAFGVTTFTGPAFYTDAAKFQKVHFEEIAEGKAKFAKTAPDGWVAMVQHYFVSAWLPEVGVEREFFARKVANGLYSAGVILPVDAIAPGASGTAESRLYVGPQEQDKLQDIAPGLDLVVDYGWLTVIAAPLFWVLSWLHDMLGNWGWAIILVTVLLKLLFFPLSAASYKSMAKMRVLGPRMQRMKELYGDDKAKMQQEMMNLYRTEKINPLGGCLPILVQIPVFIALYWVLLGSVEMRQAPWLGWIQDLSAKDPYFILPVIMGASMLIQMKLNPTPPDPLQAKVMMAMPIVFTFMFLWFPSGLVLYWVVNNILSIAQQWQITRMIESAKAGSKPA